jgi:hypothetical protein
MTKTLPYSLFGIGKIPAQLAVQLKSEGSLVWDEGIRGSATYIDFRAPGKYSRWRRQWHTASIVLTNVRLFAMQYARPIIDVPLTEERIRSMQFSLENANTFLVAFDAALFHNDWSGKIEYRFHTRQAPDFLNRLRSLMAGAS